jgi:RNA polymerase sigma-70 factor (ECF subfamily)
MHEWTDRVAGGFMDVDDELAQEFDALLVENSALAFRVAFSVLRHRQDAEDVAQEAFAKAHVRFKQLRDRRRFRSWLVRIVWRLALDHRRAERRRSARESEHGRSRGAGSADARVSNERSAMLWDAIDRLPEKLRQVIVLASIKGHDVAEVAALLRVPVGTVKSRLFLARQRLREHLQWLKTESTTR